MIVYFPQEECERPGACCACLENLLYLWLMHKAPPSPHFPLFASLMSRVTSQHDNTVVTLGRLKDLGEGLQGCQPARPLVTSRDLHPVQRQQLVHTLPAQRAAVSLSLFIPLS